MGTRKANPRSASCATARQTRRRPGFSATACRWRPSQLVGTGGVGVPSFARALQPATRGAPEQAACLPRSPAAEAFTAADDPGFPNYSEKDDRPGGQAHASPPRCASGSEAITIHLVVKGFRIDICSGRADGSSQSRKRNQRTEDGLHGGLLQLHKRCSRHHCQPSSPRLMLGRFADARSDLKHRSATKLRKPSRTVAARPNPLS